MLTPHSCFAGTWRNVNHCFYHQLVEGWVLIEAFHNFFPPWRALHSSPHLPWALTQKPGVGQLTVSVRSLSTQWCWAQTPHEQELSAEHNHSDTRGGEWQINCCVSPSNNSSIIISPSRSDPKKAHCWWQDISSVDMHIMSWPYVVWNHLPFLGLGMRSLKKGVEGEEKCISCKDSIAFLSTPDAYILQRVYNTHLTKPPNRRLRSTEPNFPYFWDQKGR